MYIQFEDMNLQDITFLTVQINGEDINEVLSPEGWCDTCDRDDCPCAESRGDEKSWDYRKRTVGEQDKKCIEHLKVNTQLSSDDLQLCIDDGSYVRF